MSKIETVEELIAQKNRICNIYHCENCPLLGLNGECIFTNTLRAIEVIEGWAEKHPVKTRLTEYKKVFPDAKIRSNGYPSADPCTISKLFDDGKCAEMIYCDECRKEYWNEVVE